MLSAPCLLSTVHTVDNPNLVRKIFSDQNFRFEPILFLRHPLCSTRVQSNPDLYYLFCFCSNYDFRVFLHWAVTCLNATVLAKHFVLS